MKAHLHNLSIKSWALLVLPAILIAYPIMRCVVPVVLHAVVPEAVRSVLSMI
jgi:hypothetical protein